MRLEVLLAGFFFALTAHGQDKLISGPGSTLTENRCKLCHELQHIRRAPLSRGEWADNLKNMKERGTPMTEAEMAVILDYLSVYYNREKPAPAPSPDTLAEGQGDATQKLATDKGCLACHHAERRVVGPSFREIGAKYASDPAASERLAGRIRAGSQGAWGNVPMPPNAVSAEEAATLSGWVLQQK